jgi:hypothetical protein
MKLHYVSFKTKIRVAAVILLLEAVFFASFWFVGALSGSDSNRHSPELPPLAGLTETSGTVVDFSTSQRRFRSYYAPIVEFSANGGPQQLITRSGYNREAIPFRQGDTVLVLYESANPEDAWLKWEYERYVQEVNTPRFADIAGAFFTGVALVIIGLTVVLLLFYIVTPIKAN